MSVSRSLNLLDLSAACVASTSLAAVAIRRLAQDPEARLKADGSVVTDADFAAQSILVRCIQRIAPNIRIVGEENAVEIKEHHQNYEYWDQAIYQRAQAEVYRRYQKQQTPPMPLSRDYKTQETFLETPEDLLVDPARVSVIIDPLDGTKAYSNGDFSVVSILLCITLDHQPHFGVIGKPFGYIDATLPTLLDTTCVTVYGGPLLDGVYTAGGAQITITPTGLPKAVISSSRSDGVVYDFCAYLGTIGKLDQEPLKVAGAGEKSLRLVLQTDRAGLWFFPKPGTSLWDVAASDALLRVLGGKLTDRHGKPLDYSKSREEAQNLEGVVACSDAQLHADVLRLFGEWEST